MKTKERLFWETYNGKRIININYAGLNSSTPQDEKEALDFADIVHEFIMNAGKDLLIFVDVTDSYASSATTKKLKENLKEEKPLIAKEAVIGINKAKSILLKGLNLFSKVEICAFETEKEAKDWLTKN